MAGWGASMDNGSIDSAEVEGSDGGVSSWGMAYDVAA